MTKHTSFKYFDAMITRAVLYKFILILVPGILIILPPSICQTDMLNPCEVLSDQLLEDVFEVNLTESNREWSSSINPTCTVTWAKPNIEELKKKYQDALSQYMQDKIAGKDVKMPVYPSNNEVSLTVSGRIFSDEYDAANSFDVAMKKLEEGTTMELNGKIETMFQYQTVPVKDVADNAHWVEGLSQLSVLAGTTIFHVKVRVYENPEENVRTAKFLAKRLAKSLNEY